MWDSVVTSRNTKTIYSVDFSTICRRARGGNPCIYCYVYRGRLQGFPAKKLIDYAPYDGSVMKLTQKAVAMLNSIGGLRLFAFGDYQEDHDDDIAAMLSDASERRLKVKVITKETLFVTKYHDHPAISVIHLSVDSLAGNRCGRSPIGLDRAKRFREDYEKVLIRAVILNWDDIGKLEPHSDILTLNHKILPAQRGRTFHMFSKAERTQVARRFPGRVCAASGKGKCRECFVKCGGLLLKRKLDALHGDPHKFVVA